MDYSRIKELRIDSDTTQQELAQYLHVTRSAYSNYENGLREIPIEVLSGLASPRATSLAPRNFWVYPTAISINCPI